MKKILLKLLQDIIYDICGGALLATGIYIFIKNANFAPGGVSGLAIIINHFSGLPIGVITLIINVPVIALTYRYLGRGFFLRSLKSMIISAFILDVVFPHFPAYTGEPLMSAIFAGLFTGIGLALIYMRDSSTGGSDFWVLAIRKRNPHLSIGQVNIASSALIIIFGGFVYENINAVLYGIITTIITSIMIDKILYGISSGKVLLIISDHGMEIAQLIEEMTGRGSTLIKAIGTYSKNEKNILICACNKSQVVKVRKAAHSVDALALVIITESNEVFGEGFKEIDSYM